MGLNSILLIVLILFCTYIFYILLKQKGIFGSKFIKYNELLNDKLNNLSKDLSSGFDDQGNLLTDISIMNSASKEIITAPFQHLSFEETLDLQKFSDEIKNTELVRCSNQLTETYGLPVAKGAQLVESVTKVNDSAIVWKLSKEGNKLLKTGKIKFVNEKGTKKILSTLQDAKSGKWVKQIKGVKISHAAKAAKLANVAVNAAHIIAGIDQMNKLKEIDRKISFLLEGRRIDKVSKLKANFRLAKELFSQPIGLHERAQLMDIHKDLLELRLNWFSEIDYKMENIKDPESLDFFKKKFTPSKTKDKKIANQISDFQNEVNLINATLFLDAGLCYGISHNSSLDEDINRLEKLESKMKEKKSYLSGKTDVNLNSDLEKIQFIKNSYLHFDPIINSNIVYAESN